MNRRPDLAFAAALAVLGATAAPAAAPELAGRYTVTARTVMPHLEEMRRRTTVETRCLDGAAPDALFPVLRQRAFTGCHLVPDAAAGVSRYRLRCADDRVATGSARIETEPGRLDGDLEVKMGGKNMTFSQFVSAERRGPCGEAGVTP